MKNKRLGKYLQQKAARKNDTIHKKNIQQHPDKRIDQDFPGYPHAPAKEEIINPQTEQEKKVAAIDSRDGEKQINPSSKKKTRSSATETEEERSDGSANAFEATERVNDDE
ncbi:MAG TPA: hypothetical protein VJ111_12125 [Chitinophagaceae bacterium]|nr:hypothetical protein [Chitinophagaceae bacterium]